MEHSGKGILVVDDETAILQIVSEFHRHAGYTTIFTAPSALAARKIWAEESERISLIITDLVLPDGRGTLLARDFLYANPKCRAIMMTGYSPEHVDLGGHLNERAVLLQKPFSAPDLLRLTNACLIPST
jgi:two-component system cell cycle sensor histidine kinase/response regulator CckA